MSLNHNTNPSDADTNKDWDYPPLTADEFESIVHYYIHDGGVHTSDKGRDYTLVVSLPLVSEECYNRIGHIVNLRLVPVDGGSGQISITRSIKGKKTLDALGDINQIFTFVNHHESKEAGE